MSKGLIDIILDQIFDADWKGRRGEKLTERELKLVKLFGRNGKILRNVYVPKGNGETSEIDVMFITQKGIFVIESKNYSGWIFGNESDQYWTASLPGGKKNHFYNPIMQNRGHIKWLGQYLGDDTPLFSIVAFSERCELKKVTIMSGTVRVIKRDRLYATVRSLWTGAKDAVDEVGIARLYDRLKLLANVSEAEKVTHVANIEHDLSTPLKNQGKTLMQMADGLEDIPLACPRCGADLILRTAKKGSNVGNRFYGCSNYPKCRFTRSL